MKKPESNVIIEIEEIKTGSVELSIIGRTPLLFNAMSAKAKRELLYPRKKTKAERESTVKHDPMAEFEDSVYRITAREQQPPTLLAMPSTALKAAMTDVCTRIANTTVTKAKVGTLIWVVGDRIPVYGIPQLSMMGVRSSDMARTPDIRTRAIVPHWCLTFVVEFESQQMNPQTLANLAAHAGIKMGIGDGRQEKGALNYGSFIVCDKADKAFQSIVSTGGHEAQKAAMANPGFYDDESAELFDWWQASVKQSGRQEQIRKRAA